MSKTHMNKGNRVCVGGFDLDTGSNVRLLTHNAENQPDTTPFSIGQIWDLRVIKRSRCIPPHVEDVLVQSSSIAGNQPQMRAFIEGNCPIVAGPLASTFDGRLRFTSGGSGYIVQSSGLPSGSVCFWRPSVALARRDYDDKIKYEFTQNLIQRRRIGWVGLQPPLPVIPAGTLLRLSLARWWKPRDAPASEEEKCFLQISGYFR